AADRCAGTPSNAAGASEDAELSIEAGVLLRNGEIRRVARTPLILLNADFAEKLLQVFSQGKRNAYLQGQVYLSKKRFMQMAGKTDKQVAEMDEFVKAHTV